MDNFEIIIVEEENNTDNFGKKYNLKKSQIIV